jgi:hypothetical protein
MPATSTSASWPCVERAAAVNYNQELHRLLPIAAPAANLQQNLSH